MCKRIRVKFDSFGDGHRMVHLNGPGFLVIGLLMKEFKPGTALLGGYVGPSDASGYRAASIRVHRATVALTVKVGR